ncbi:MAG: hypothetical protein GDA48_13715 [Hormoscilla sp. GM102CHS1]|nr:hypothetical protein [Hormoscilla sp. GM102CHS1]
MNAHYLYEQLAQDTIVRFWARFHQRTVASPAPQSNPARYFRFDRV